MKGKKVLLGVTGSIAAFKAPLIVRALQEKGHQVQCLMTKSAEQFVSRLVLSTLTQKPVVSDMFSGQASDMPHLSMAQQAEVLLVAPVSALVLGRCAHGLAEDMITLTYLTTTAPTIMAPAMHDTMWNHASTQANVKTLTSRGVRFVGPISGKLADNNEGIGRMADIDQLVSAVTDL